MMRRDYILRMVAEMAQVLSRVMALKGRQDYETALREIDRALRDLRASTGEETNPASLEDWIGLCRKHEAAASGLMVAVADLLKEQGEIKIQRNAAKEGQTACGLGLGLMLEALLNGETFVSAELLDKVEQLIQTARNGSLERAVWTRLIQYYVARGQLARAEDALFDWAETGDPSARAFGERFYSQLMDLQDDELERGGLSRAEVAQGSQDFLRCFEP